jgi:hypothetical protein
MKEAANLGLLAASDMALMGLPLLGFHFLDQSLDIFRRPRFQDVSYHGVGQLLGNLCEFGRNRHSGRVTRVASLNPCRATARIGMTDLESGHLGISPEGILSQRVKMIEAIHLLARSNH